MPRHPSSSKKTGAPPGSLIHVGPRRVSSPAIRIVHYGPGTFKESTRSSVPPSIDPPAGTAVSWITLTGLHEVDSVSALGKLFSLPALAVEDILNTAGRIKIEDLGDSLLIITRMVYPDSESCTIESRHAALVLLPQTVLLFSEDNVPVFAPLEERLKRSSGRIRQSGADYLAWALLDCIVDHQFAVINLLEDRLLDLESRVLEDAFAIDLRDLLGLRRNLLEVYRILRSVQEEVLGLRRSESLLLSPELRPFLSDLADHAVHASDTLDHLAGLAAGLRDHINAAASNRLNQVMKTLTCFSALFLPLSFLAAVYGMNFRHMPELKVPWAYPALWGAFSLIALFMLLIFRRNRWI